MKNSSSEPPLKKLKQARLPFQILSPGAENPVASQPLQRKRKASDVPGDNIVNEIVEVNKNKLSPLEKKPKISESIHKNETAENKNNVEESMEIEDIECGNNSKKEESKTPKSTKEKPIKSKNPLSSKKATKPTSNLKTKNNKKKKSTVFKQPTEKCTTKEPPVVDVVDLCDSPCKTDGATTRKSENPTLEDTNKEGVQVDDDLKSKLKNDSNEVEPIENLSGVNTDSGKGNGTKQSVSKDISSILVDSKTNDGKEIANEKGGMPNQNSLIMEDVGAKENKDHSKSMENYIKSKTEISNDETNNSNEISNEKSDVTPNKDNLTKSAVVSNKKKKSKSGEKELKDKKKVSIKEMMIKMSSKTDNMKKVVCDNSNTNANSSEVGTDPSSSDKSPVGGAVSLKTSPSVKDCSLSDISISSECSTPSSAGVLKTPISSKKSTPRRMTPKQLLKLKEKEEKLQERERLKQEREIKKNTEKEERDRQKLAKEEEKKKEKEEKERIKQAETAKKEEEKKIKEEEKKIKEEEKRKKEEDKRSKDEEKRKREEEEKQRKEEKRLKEEQKEAGKRKSAQAFANFFLKAESPKTSTNVETETTICDLTFQPFELKNDMRLAPVQRSLLSEERRQALDGAVGVGDRGHPTSRSYLEEVRSTTYSRGAAPRTWQLDVENDDVIIIESENPNQEMETDVEQNEKKCEKKKQRAKLLQFHENRRPPYWGTWRKTSKFIRPRAPINMDKAMFEYEVDSDDEWEEPEDGESLRGSEDEEEGLDEQYEEDDDMFVPHGYLSDEEGQDELDDKSPEAMKAKLKFLQMEFEAERNEKQERLKPRLIGCVWFCNSISEPSEVGSHIAELFLSRRAVWEGSLPLTITPSTPPSPSADNNENSTSVSKGGAKKRFVHDSMIPDIIKRVHGSRKKLSKILCEFLEEQQDKTLNPSKRCLVDKIREIASWEKNSDIGHHCWFVKEEVRQAHSLMELVIEPSVKPVVPLSPKIEKNPSANITKFTKVLTSDERLKLLRESPSAPSTSTAERGHFGVGREKEENSLSGKKPNTLFSTPTVKLRPAPLVKKRVALLSVGLAQQLPTDQASHSSLQTEPSISQVSKESKDAETPSSIVQTESPNIEPTSHQSSNTKTEKSSIMKFFKNNSISQNPTPLKETSKSSIANFLQKKETVENKCPTSTNEEPAKSNEKIKKRIKPITLTSILPKPSKISTASADDCVVLSD